MKKPIIQIIILLAVIAGLVIALISLKGIKNSPFVNDVETIDEFSIFSVDADDITAFSYTIESGELLSFHLDNDQWIYDYDESIDIDEEKVSDVLQVLKNLSAKDIYEGAEAEIYGLDDPDIYISITTTDYCTEIYFGKINSDANESYACFNGDTSSIYLCDSKMTDVTSYGLDYFKAQ